MAEMNEMDKQQVRDMVFTVLDSSLISKKGNCPENIIDLVFIEIEKAHDKEYRALKKTYTEHRINPMIAKRVKAHWDLINLDICKTPQSTLIKTYRRLRNR